MEHGSRRGIDRGSVGKSVGPWRVSVPFVGCCRSHLRIRPWGCQRDFCECFGGASILPAVSLDAA
eukprot:2253858-Alexandrium_andersonii.AAC.1